MPLPNLIGQAFDLAPLENDEPCLAQVTRAECGIAFGRWGASAMENETTIGVATAQGGG